MINTVQDAIDRIDLIDEMIEACESEKTFDSDDYCDLHELLKEYRIYLLDRKVEL